jgi:hypothetical protein
MTVHDTRRIIPCPVAASRFAARFEWDGLGLARQSRPKGTFFEIKRLPATGLCGETKEKPKIRPCLSVIIVYLIIIYALG